MCEFVSDQGVMPGWICCKCRSYNGLQRVRCKIDDCRNPRHDIQIPPTVQQCTCGFGWEGNVDWSATAAGRVVAGVCPVCGKKLVSKEAPPS